MINKVNRYALIAALAMFLSGCMVQRESMPVEEARPMPEQPAQLRQSVPVMSTVPTISQQPGPIEHEDQTTQPTPHQCHCDWSGAMQPMVGKMLQADDIKAGGVLLADSANNRTSGSLSAGGTTETLHSALADSGKFTLVFTQQLTVAKQQSDLLPNDSLGARSKAIGIAHNIGAQHVLYSSTSGNVSSPALQM